MWLTTIKRLGLNQGICYEKKIYNIMWATNLKKKETI